VTDFKEQDMCIKFCFILGKIATETYMLKLAFEGETISRTQTFKWFLKFRSGMTSVKDAECSSTT
jgi:hypothetical protein